MATKPSAPRLTIDLVNFALAESQLYVLLTQRDKPPFAEQWALPATEIDLISDVTLEGSVKRQLVERISVAPPYVEQVQTFGNRLRDPRGWSVTIVYYSLISYPLGATPLPQKMQWFTLTHALKMPLAFDHKELVTACWQRFQNKALYTSLPIFLLPKEFTLTELQKAYEVILGFTMEKKSFRRRLLDAGCLVESGNIRRANHRPAQLYRLANKQPYFFARIIEGARDNKPL